MQAKKSFELANPDVQIVIEQVADNFESLREFQSDTPPDIMDSGGWGLLDQPNVFIDLLPFVGETPGLEEDLNKGIMRVACKNGTLPGLPVDVSLPLILINKPMFDQEGLPYPSEDWTWEEMVQLAKRLTIRNEEGIATQFGFANGVDIENFEPFVMRNGGRYLSQDGSTAKGYVDSDAAVEAMRKVVDLYRIHHVTRKPGEPSQAGQLADGFAIIFGFTWFVGDVTDKGRAEQFEVLGLPRMPGGQEANMIYMGGAGITTKCPHPELAWAFLRHYKLEQPDNFRKPWNLPLTKSLADKSGMSSHRIWSRYLQELDSVQASGFYLSDKWNTARQLINEDLHKMIIDGADVRQLMKSWTRFA
jgi:multiple sugar transport system substrate-binding protein